MTQDIRETNFNNWKEREALAESLIPMIGTLYRQKDVITSVFGRPIINRSVIDIIKAHRFTRQVTDKELTVSDTYPVVEVLSKLDLSPSRIDIGKLAAKFAKEGAGQDLESFIKSELDDVIGNQRPAGADSHDVVLYGFGRIGRLLARILIEKAGPTHSLHLKAIVVRKGKGNDLLKRASLLRRDSVHGSFKGTIQIDEENNGLIVNGNYIQVIYANDPASIDYTQYGVNNALVIDNTGVWRDEEGLGQHLQAKGVVKVLLTAPGKGNLKNVVYGVNHNMVDENDKILSAASCTTNAITPVLKAVNDKYGVVSGHVETVHSYTNDQNLIDNYHKGDRRGRAAALNMVITETGAAKAVSKALPELEGKLTGNAIRVPTPNVSMAILSLTLEKEATVEDINNYLRGIALDSPLQKQVDYVESPEVVSTDFVGNRQAGIVDGEATIVSGNRVNLYVWYDNEFGYSCQVIRFAQQLMGIHYPAYPPRG